MSGYSPREVEGRIYGLWERGGYFAARRDPQRRPFTIVIPPPNVTGALHLGHALNNTLQDILIRHRRMCGRVACWLPGTDHAGIATQAVVEKRLREEEGLTRQALGREGLVARIWAWKEEYHARILDQLRQMGCSCDWSRTRFTLDEVCARAVYELFFRLFRDGLIYRGLRLVNWDTQLQTAVADDEVYHERVRGSLWYVRYPLEGRDAAAPGAQAGRDYLVVATTRPETMLGDTAVAVHPQDARYAHLVGRRCVLPLLHRPIPVIADPVLVRPEFGSGCVKVTPGHDPNDYQCALRHGLEMINILTPDGRINERGGPYAGLSKEEARRRVVADLEAAGLLEKVEPYETEVGHSDRSKKPIEPLLSEQWFVRMEKLAEAAMEAVRDGRVRFFPPRYARSYLDWLAEKRDWCISRQLWWGHRIPVWSRRMSVGRLRELLVSGDGAALVMAGADLNACVRVTLPDGRELIFDAPEKLAPLRALDADLELDWYVCLRDPQARWPGDRATVAERLERDGFVQDPDVLDTWFSSALWPLSTFGWPQRSADLDYFVPTDVLSTARDIISLWVARMVMVSLYATGHVPFAHVLIHPTIQDGQGRRMSKSLGNGVDPLDLIELYGADAMRFTLAQFAGQTQDVRVPVQPEKLPDGRVVNSSPRFVLGRNFCNKLWQLATGLVLPRAEGLPFGPLEPAALALEDRWILSRLRAAIEAADRCLARYEFQELTAALYAFFWNELCDWYAELIKPRLSGPADGSAAGGTVAAQVLAAVLDQTLRLLHPVVPFITEALWQELNRRVPQRGVFALWSGADEPALIAARWPRAEDWPADPQAETQMRALQEVIVALRDVRARVNRRRAAEKRPAVRALPLACVRADEQTSRLLGAHEAALCRLGEVERVEIGPHVSRPPGAAARVLRDAELYVPLAGLADPRLWRQALEKELAELDEQHRRVRERLDNPAFRQRAAPEVVEREQARLAELEERRAAVADHLRELESL